MVINPSTEVNCGFNKLHISFEQRNNILLIPACNPAIENIQFHFQWFVFILPTGNSNKKLWIIRPYKCRSTKK